MSVSTKPKLSLDTTPAIIPGRRIQSLDCLRAIACLVVILSHTSKITAPGGWSIGAYGVCLFCVLSGYLISRLLLDEEQKHKTIRPIRFLQRRFLRIVPAYFAVLVSCTLLMRTGWFLKNHPEHITKSISDFAYFATFTHNSGEGFALNHLWSISVEEQFYCLLPLLFLTIRNMLARQIVLTSVALILVRFIHLDYDCNAAFIPLVCGSLLGFSINPISTILNRLGVFTTVWSSAFLILMSVIFESCPYGPLASTGFVLLIWLAAKKVEHIPGLASLAYIGSISYCVYLVHMPVRWVSFRLLDLLGLAHITFLHFGLTACASIAIAALSWELFEKRILELKHRIPDNVFGYLIAFISPVLILVGLTIHALHRN